MNSLMEAYDLPVEGLVPFYQRLNQPIAYPDGMLISLGIIYWGRDEHLAAIEKSIPLLVENSLFRFTAVLKTIKTPAGAQKLAAKTGIPLAILRILKHDFELWLPQAVPLSQFAWFNNNPQALDALARIGLTDQLAVISAGQTPVQRQAVAQQSGLDAVSVAEGVRLCDFYRSGKNLEHIRAKIYYAMGLDTWQKWAEVTAEDVIALFTRYVKENNLASERLVPWTKEVRNGIEWARRHLEIFAVEW